MPHFDYRCLHCGHEDSHLILLSEKPSAPCHVCGTVGLAWRFNPTRSKAIVYANDVNLSGGEQFTGPRQKERWLHERGLVALGDADYDTSQKPAAAAAAAREKKEEAETFDAIMEDMRHYEDSQIMIGDETREDDPITGHDGPTLDRERLGVDPAAPIESFGMEAADVAD